MPKRRRYVDEDEDYLLADTILMRRRNSQWPAVQGAQRPRHAKRMQVATSGTRHVRMRVETSGRIKAFLSRRKVAAGQICNVWRVLCYAF